MGSRQPPAGLVVEGREALRVAGNIPVYLE